MINPLQPFLTAIVATVLTIGATDMKAPPNWGRSAKNAPGQRSELVRVETKYPRDFTIYMAGFNNPQRTVAELGLYHVSVGNGGIARELLLQAPVPGLVTHVVAQSIAVHCEFSSAGGLGTTFARAMAGIGTPHSTHFEQVYAISGGSNEIVTIPEWTRRMRVVALDDASPPSVHAFQPLGVYVNQRYATGLSISVRPASHFEEFTELEPSASQVQFSADLLTPARFMVTWELYM